MTATAQNGINKKPVITVNQPLTFVLNPDDLGNIIDALKKFPYEKVAGTIQSIEQQVIEQMQPVKSVVNEEVKETFPQ